MKRILTEFIDSRELSRQAAREFMVGVTENRFDPLQVGALLYAMQVSGITVGELLGFRDALLQTGAHLDFSDLDLLDIVGTGGDGKNTFNISTCAAFVIAGTGQKVCKHGNYSATSVSGAGNVLEAHGAKFSADPDKLRRTLEESGFVYLHAPLFAYGMKHVAPVRKALKVPTVFNILGPLINPAQPRKNLHGVASRDQLRLYTAVHQQIGDRFGIVNSYDGYDEVSLTGSFKLVANSREGVFTAADLGLPQIHPEEIYGGETIGQAVGIFDDVLNGTASQAQTDVVIANAALGLFVADQTRSLCDCVEAAAESLRSGRALEVLKKYVALTAD